MKHLLRKGQMSPSYVFSLYTCIFMDMILISAFKRKLKLVPFSLDLSRTAN